MYVRKVTAKRGHATMSLIRLLTHLKVNRHHISRLIMNKTTSCKPGEYRLEVYTDDT